MATMSLCMIVKNEESVLKRCLDSIKGLFDEIIIVDTGSTDATKDIAKQYTANIYDFEWTGSFADARNYSFSKATKDYIYVADADEYVDANNYRKFLNLKKVLRDEVDIVQMKYVTISDFSTVYNTKKELRPKLFKRLRSFVWEGDVHETVRLSPIIFDSDIEIEHRPVGNHAKRDIEIFEKMIDKNTIFTDKLLKMYIRELYTNGKIANYEKARSFLEKNLSERKPDDELFGTITTILVKIYRELSCTDLMFSQALKDVILESSSEVCYELGVYFFEKNMLEEASTWFFNAAYETMPCIDIRSKSLFPYEKLAIIYRKMATYDLENKELLLKNASEFENIVKDFVMPEE